MLWRLSLAIVIGTLILSVRPAAAQRTGPGAKAMLNLPDATAAAKKWSSDAILTSVSSTKVDENGLGDPWFYGFYSPKKDSYLNVTATNGEVDAIPVGEGRTAPVARGFMDSDVVMKAAFKEGLKGENPTMLLIDSTWIVTGGQEKGNSILIFNSKTARIIKRNAVE